MAALAALVLVPGLALAVPAASAAGEDAAAGTTLGDVTGMERDGDTFTFAAETSAQGEAKLRVSFLEAGALRVWLAPDGEFTDPANDTPSDPDAPAARIVVGDLDGDAGATLTETSSAYRIATADATLTVTRSPLTLALADGDGTPLWTETAPLSWDSSGTTQSLSRGATEQFFGGGMQNGRFSHRDETIQISRDYDWDDGGNPNASPFYLSSNGYGVLRNTFAAGSYAFGEPVATRHAEQRFDAYYFVGDTRAVLDDLTRLTGRPAMLPMYAMELGDADCYLHNANRGERETLRDSTAIAQGYTDNDMPLGWMLVNDGYGCGYEDLPETHDMLTQHGSELGLWTQADLTEQPTEVASGVRVRKTDVAWVGPGYRFALSACEKANAGIEDNSADRATVVTIEGWAGTQRCGAMWSGDQSGSWDYIRWQIPTYAGSTMSGQAATTGDVDGIFGGSAQTYTRDLQWKMFLPMTYAMSGWAASDKQPYRYGEPYTSINRSYLQLHERLLPYLYTYQADAHATGLGSTRPLYVDYPDDPTTWGDDVKYEFLAGDDFLVAPVYEDTTVRDGIYLPKGTWTDYWTGRTYTGPTTIDGYPAPLDRLPLFVRGGAIVPMFPEGTADWEAGKKAGRLDVDVYPQGSSEFTLYEDDGRTQEYADGAHASQRLAVRAPQAGKGPIALTVGALTGDYAGKPSARSYRFALHTDTAPATVRVGGEKLAAADSVEDLDRGPGYVFDPASGVLTVQTATVSTASAFDVRVTGSSAVGGEHPGERAVDVAVTAPSLSLAGTVGTATLALTNHTGKPIDVTGATLTAPDGWTVDATSSTTAKALKDGATFSATFGVTPPEDAAPGQVTIGGTADYRVRTTPRQVSARAQTTVAYADLAAAFDNVAISSLAEPEKGDVDGGGSSFIAERLAEKGVAPGATVSANGFDFTFPSSEPGTPDNVGSAGQTVPVSGDGNVIGVLGTGTSGSATGGVTVHYADGSTDASTLGMPNWCCLATNSYGAKIAVVTLGKNTPTGAAYPTTQYRLYTNTIPIDPDKEVVAVTLPANAAVHVFALSVGTEVVVPPPVADGQYSLTLASGQRLTAPGNDSTQLTVAAESSAPTQKWILTRLGGSDYTVRNAGSGQCADVFFSSKDQGALVGQYGCGGTDNQVWQVSVEDGRLRLVNKNSGLALTADPDGRVVQRTDTGAASQRWAAAAS
ncbi:TIM-barrel domain-containing protein [Isoptericola sp. NPDC057653]|uniref:TIM-barrel domain-containing protein n=2 Tax=unclassified Isoptericola TaxID=2623355 RepID=UPI0036ABC499